MKTNLLATLTSRLGKDIAAQASRSLFESQSGTLAAVNAILPALLASLAHRASTTRGATEVSDLVNGADVDPRVLGSLTGLFSGGARTRALVSLGSPLVSRLLGADRVNPLASAIAAQTGIKSTSALSLLAMVAPLVLAFLKGFATDNRLDATGLATLLGSQRGILERTGLDSRVLKALDFGSLTEMMAGPGASAPARYLAGASPMTNVAAASAMRMADDAVTANAKSDFARVWPWLLGLLVLWLLWSLWRSADAPATPRIAPRSAASAATAATSGLPARIFFDASATALGREGANAIARAAAEARFTHAQIEVTGYADEAGDPAANEALARNRARTVRDALVAAGIPEARIAVKQPTFVAGSGSGAEARRVEITKGM